MAETKLLEQLKDIQLPPLISWWPLAPGWYGLILLVMISIITFALGRYYYNKTRIKREALKILKNYEQQYFITAGDSQLISAKLSELLRRVALAYFPRSEVARLYGHEWLTFLNRTGKNIDFESVGESLLLLPYQTKQNADLSPLFYCVKSWICQRGML